MRRKVSAVIGLTTALLRSLRQATVTKSASCVISNGVPENSSAKAAPSGPAGTVILVLPWWVMRPGAVRSTEQ